MNSRTVRVCLIVDQCGRVLIHEREQPAHGESCREMPSQWHTAPGVKRYEVEVTVPIPKAEPASASRPFEIDSDGHRVEGFSGQQGPAPEPTP